MKHIILNQLNTRRELWKFISRKSFLCFASDRPLRPTAESGAKLPRGCLFTPRQPSSLLRPRDLPSLRYLEVSYTSPSPQIRFASPC